MQCVMEVESMASDDSISVETSVIPDELRTTLVQSCQASVKQPDNADNDTPAAVVKPVSVQEAADRFGLTYA
jgi:hypothetical protein